MSQPEAPTIRLICIQRVYPGSPFSWWHAGENSIIIVGGANQAPWQLTDAAQSAIKSAGAVLLQREIPEHVNLQVAQVGDT